MTDEHAQPTQHLLNRRQRDSVAAQSGDPAAGALLNMPEPLVHDTGVFVFVQVQAIETSVGNRLLRQLRSWR